MSDLLSIREAFLKAVETPVATRDAMLASLTPAIRTEVVSLLSAYDSAGDFLGPARLEDTAPAGTIIGPYQVQEKIGQGGMGVVYRARRADGEFERDVAIKFVGGRLFAPEAERRFIAERRILALLDHPNIVRMIDGGVWQNQRYLVMEWVAGVSVTQYCADQPIARRLQLFREICAAIQYAHQRLVLHRDIKAANILVTPEGQAKVLDFGIARLLGSEDGGPETTMLHPMSLSCASPEQLRGEPLTLSSDIYSLGLLLHELLTGTNPQASGTTSQIRQRIEAGEIPAPSKTDPRLPRDLDAIVLKAVAHDPQIRYGSAAEMSADVGRFLDSHPVMARTPSKLYYATRFISRNRALTATAIALVIAIVSGLGAALWQAHRAEQNRQLAERRFADARRLVYTVIHDIQPKMADINGTVQLRVQLIEKTLIYLEALRQDAGDDPALMSELIDGYVALAGVAGSLSQANVGETRKSGEILEKAQVLGERLGQVQPLAPACSRSLSRLYQAVARHFAVAGQRPLAIQAARRAVEFSQSLGSDDIAHASVALADVTVDQKESIALYEKAAGVWSKAIAANPADALSLGNRLAVIYRNLSTAWLKQKDYESALGNGEKARDLDEVALKGNPASPVTQLAVAFDVGAIGAAYTEMGRYVPAADNWRRSVELREQVLAANVQDYRARDRLAFAVHELAKLEQLLGDRNAATRHFEQAISFYAKLSESGPLNRQSLFKYAASNRLLGLLTRQAGESVRGCALLLKAADLAALYQKGGTDSKGNEEIREFRADAASCSTHIKSRP